MSPRSEAPTSSAAPAIDYFSSAHPLRGWATQRALRARCAMYRRFRQSVPFDETTSVLDVGVTPDTTLADSNYFEQLYPHTHRITATSIEDASALELRFPGIRFVRTQGVRLPFGDTAFDVVFCSAVVEHVGTRAHQRMFVDELLRVGRTVFLTTPNRWFPLELHTFLPLVHWLPQPLHQAVLKRLGKGFWASTDNLNLLTPRALLDLFDAADTVTLQRHRTMGLTSNLVVVATSRQR